MRIPPRLHCIVGASLLFRCGSEPDTQLQSVEATAELPPGFPAPRIPEDNPLSPEKAKLGRWLFYDERLSGNGTQSCSSCHEQRLAFADGKATGEGSTGQLLARNSPGLANAAYNATLAWANPVLRQFEDQLLVPIFGEQPVELGVTGNESEVLARLLEDERYVQMFADAFPEQTDAVDFNAIVQALSSFLRTIISGNSPFDEFTYGGQPNALSPSARRGMDLFYSERLECHHCHGGFNFTQSTVTADTAFDTSRFHNTGLYNIDGQGGYPANNTGLHDFTGDLSDMGKFRAPSLRNVALTGPYMHDGSVETLREVLEIYAAGGREIVEGQYRGDGRLNPLKSGFMIGFTLSEQELQDVLSFLESLTDPQLLSAEHLSDPFASPNE